MGGFEYLFDAFVTFQHTTNDENTRDGYIDIFRNSLLKYALGQAWAYSLQQLVRRQRLRDADLPLILCLMVVLRIGSP